MAMADIQVNVVSLFDVLFDKLLGPVAPGANVMDILVLLGLRCTEVRTVGQQLKVDSRDGDCLLYVAPARDSSEQNLEAVLKEGQLYLRTTRDIKAGQELLAWYSHDLAAALKVPDVGTLGVKGVKALTCPYCHEVFLYPNPLRAHLMYRCERRLAQVHGMEAFNRFQLDLLSVHRFPTELRTRALSKGTTFEGPLLANYLDGRRQALSNPTLPLQSLLHSPGSQIVKTPIQHGSNEQSESPPKDHHNGRSKANGMWLQKRKFVNDISRDPESQTSSSQPFKTKFSRETTSSNNSQDTTLLSPSSTTITSDAGSAFKKVDRSNRGSPASLKFHSGSQSPVVGSTPSIPPPPSIITYETCEPLYTCANTMRSLYQRNSPPVGTAPNAIPVRSPLSSAFAPTGKVLDVASGSGRGTASTPTSKLLEDLKQHSGLMTIDTMVTSSGVEMMQDSGHGTLYPDPLCRLPVGLPPYTKIIGGPPVHDRVGNGGQSTGTLLKVQTCTTSTPSALSPLAAASLLPPSLAALTFPAQNWCAKCNASFRMTSDLVYHMRSHHKRETDPMKKKREEKLKCSICNESFRERHHLTRHMTSHQ